MQKKDLHANMEAMETIAAAWEAATPTPEEASKIWAEAWKAFTEKGTKNGF